MQNLKDEFEKIIGDEREAGKLEKIIKDGCYQIAKKKISRLKDDNKKEKRVIELVKNFLLILKNLHIENINTVTAVLDGALKALSEEKENIIYEKIAHISKLEGEIEETKESLKNLLKRSYSDMQKLLNSLDEESAKYLEIAISDTQLKELSLLGILKETTEEAILTTIEKQKDIEKTIKQIVQNLIYQTMDEVDFNKKRLYEASKTILEVAVNIADSYQAVAKEILNGTVYGIKEAMANSIKRYNEAIEFLPDEIKSHKEEKILFEGLNIIDINKDFIDLVKEYAKKSDGISKNVLSDILIGLDSSINKLVKITADTKEIIKKKIEKLKESPKVNEFRDKFAAKLGELNIEERLKSIKKEDLENVAKESKRLGLRAWEVAKQAIDNAINSTKETFHPKDKNSEKKDLNLNNDTKERDS